MPVRKEKKKLALFIVGPTAIGKTGLSIKLAERIGGEIIICDSMQVYRGMEILSQAPSPSEKGRVRHHLICVLDPKGLYSVASFRRKAIRIIKSITNRRKIPIIVGGSGLYVKALIDGLFSSPKSNARFRSRMQKFTAHYGAARLYDNLLRIDPDAARGIHPNDTRRIIRALEIYHDTGRTMTDLKKETKGLKDYYKIRIFGLTRPRGQIYEAIGRRVDRMFKNGVLGEVGMLKKKRLSKTARAALGYKEITGFLNCDYDLDTAKYLMKRNTRHFAKRQIAWFKPDKRIKWFDVSRLSDGEIVSRIAKIIKSPSSIR